MPWARGKYTREDASENLKRHVEKGTIETLFSIYYQDKLVGRISYERFDDGRKMAEIGYWISKDVSGQGLMTLCCERLIKHIFEDTIYETILIEADARNLASRRIPEKLGFEFLGVVEFATHEEGRGFVDKARYLLRKDGTKQIKN